MYIPNSSGVVIRYTPWGVYVETGRRIPDNICSKCGRGDWKEEILTIKEALERGIIDRD